MKLSVPVVLAVSALSFTLGTLVPTTQMQSTPAAQAGTPAQTQSGAQSGTPTQPSGPRYLQVDYMKVAPGKAQAYADLEKEWRPLHQEQIRAGKIAWWALYDVRFPGGDSAEYNYVTVTAFNRFQDMENSLPQDLVTKALQGKDVEGFWSRTDAARSLVRTEVLELLDQVEQSQ
jgi:hypothetical protein